MIEHRYSRTPEDITTFEFNDLDISFESWDDVFRVFIRTHGNWATLVEIWSFGDEKINKVGPEVPTYLIDGIKLWMRSNYINSMSLEDFLNITFKNAPKEVK